MFTTAASQNSTRVVFSGLVGIQHASMPALLQRMEIASPAPQPRGFVAILLTALSAFGA